MIYKEDHFKLLKEENLCLSSFGSQVKKIQCQFFLCLGWGSCYDRENQKEFSQFLDSHGNSNIKKKNYVSFYSSQERKFPVRILRHLMLKDHHCLGFQGTSRDFNLCICKKITRNCHNMKNEREPELQWSCQCSLRYVPNNFAFFFKVC